LGVIHISGTFRLLIIFTNYISAEIKENLKNQETNMKQLIKISFLFIVLFLTIPVFADGDMGAGGRPPVTGDGKTAVSTENTTSLDSANRQEDALNDIFSWVYKQIFELID
jgi:hypothetical protein